MSGLLSVAAGSGYWRENAPQLKRVVPYFWFVLVPIASGSPLSCSATLQHSSRLKQNTRAAWRHMIALLENGQRDDGSVALPAVLAEYGAPASLPAPTAPR